MTQAYVARENENPVNLLMGSVRCLFFQWINDLKKL